MAVDGVNNCSWSKCNKIRSKCLIFKDSLLTKNVPADWQKASLVPEFQKGLRYIPENYIPVSLTPILCKLLEGMIGDHIQEFADENSTIGSLDKTQIYESLFFPYQPFDIL